jgi:DNA-binding response OmpR family regulator
VDDDLDYVHTMALIVRALGFEADFAINATAALPAARRFQPHFVLLDVGLPDGDGRELARPLRQEPGLDNVRIYCVTARVHEDPRRSLEAGCDDHFVKPLEPRFLASLLGAR